MVRVMGFEMTPNARYYTESKLAKYAELLLSELGQGTANWRPNFDASGGTGIRRKNAQRANGTTKIANGRNIPPHILNEVVLAYIWIT